MHVLSDKLAVYAQPTATCQQDRLLPGILTTSLLVFMGLGALLLTVDLMPMVRQVRQEAHRIAFFAPEPPVAEPPAPAPEPVVLPEAAVLAQAVDVPAPEPVDPPTVAAPEPADEPAPRRVYGVRKVLARGLGQGAGARQSGLVVKRGNVLDGVADTLTATAADLEGELAALSTVERAPEPLHRVKPRYSEALIAARASGVVTARLLVDTDGSVAAVEILEDLGHDSREVAAAAFRQFRFRPALRHGEPVAVWIVHRIRFEFQE
jgi:protein TonB